MILSGLRDTWTSITFKVSYRRDSITQTWFSPCWNGCIFDVLELQVRAPLVTPSQNCWKCQVFVPSHFCLLGGHHFFMNICMSVCVWVESVCPGIVFKMVYIVYAWLAIMFTSSKRRMVEYQNSQFLQHCQNMFNFVKSTRKLLVAPKKMLTKK